MHLENLLGNIGKKASFHDLIYMENHINNGSPSWFSHSHPMDERYGKAKSLSGFKIPYDELTDVESFVTSAWPSNHVERVARMTQGKMKFLIHPKEFEAGWYTSVGYTEGFPTASWRVAMILWEDHPYYAKLHYSWMLGRITREMTKKRVAWGSKISWELASLIASGKLGNYFSYYPESLWIVTKKYHNKEVGMCYREFQEWYKNKASIPFFSLMAKDPRDPESLELILQIIEQADSPKTYFLEKIVTPLILCIRDLLFKWWLLPENHGQNILLEIEESLVQNRIIHRDLYEFYVDKQIREMLWLSIDGFEKLLDVHDDPTTYFRMKSYMFDFKFWEYVLAPLTALVAKHLQIPEKELIDDIIEIFESSSTEWKEIFSPYDTAYNFDKVVQTYINGKPDFKFAGKPRFRKS